MDQTQTENVLWDCWWYKPWHLFFPTQGWIFSFIFGTKDKYLISLTNTLHEDRQSALAGFKVWQIAIIHDNFYLIVVDLLVGRKEMLCLFWSLELRIKGKCILNEWTASECGLRKKCFKPVIHRAGYHNSSDRPHWGNALHVTAVYCLSINSATHSEALIRKIDLFFLSASVNQRFMSQVQ